MPSTQDRAPLGESLAFHSHRPASSLAARQYTSLTSSAAFPNGKDSAIVNATSGAVNVTLPAGNDSIIGLPFHAERANADATSNAVALVCAGTDTFVDGGTSISSTATADAGLHLAAVWDGANWRPYFPPASGGGAAAFSSLTVGDGTGSPAANLDKSGAGVAAVNLKAAGVLRGKLSLDASENVVLSVFDGSEALLGSITLNNSTGAITLSKGTTITTGGLAITAGGLQVNGGTTKLTLVEYANDAAAGVGGLTAGQLYSTSGAVKVKT